MRSRNTRAQAGVWFGVLVGLTAFTLVVMTRPGPELSVLRVGGALAALVLGTFAVWFPVGYAALNRITDAARAGAGQE